MPDHCPHSAKPFGDDVLSFCKALSATLLADKQTQSLPDLVALGFWLRAPSISRLVDNYRALPFHFRSLGVVFHNTPNNVDSLFAYSAITSLLCGNANIVRLPARQSETTDLFVSLCQRVLIEFPSLQHRLLFFRCAHDALPPVHQLADGRILWGSNQAIRQQRQASVKAHCRDIAMVHKISGAVLDCGHINRADDNTLTAIAECFIRDTMTYAQQACSSPKFLVWAGSTEERLAAQKRFWTAIAENLKPAQITSPSQRMDALFSLQYLIHHEALASAAIDGPILRAQAPTLTHAITEHHNGNGLVVEMEVETLDDLLALNLDDFTLQTLTYSGLSDDALHRLIEMFSSGLDRLVPLGQALNFDTLWDGVDLVLQLTRLSARAEAL
ncbi:MAG: acyl-CoA reductase [Pseudomonadota bacterium]|nr:acyl-CoA reductase [Pseudomonadota bacterium]